MCTFFFRQYLWTQRTYVAGVQHRGTVCQSLSQSVSQSICFVILYIFVFAYFSFGFWLLFLVFSYIIRVVNVSVSAFESSSVAYYVYYSDPRRSLPLFLFLMDRMSEWMSEWVNECSVRAETTIWIMLFGVPFIGAFKRLAHLTFERERVKKSWRVRGCWSKD